MQMPKDSHDPLPIALYEFTVKYGGSLVESCEKFLDLIEPRSESSTYRE
jgi:hypothetical protein